MRRKKGGIKGDWFKTLQEDFKFINEEIDDEKVVTYSKQRYKTYITEKVRNTAFISYMALKEK